MISLCDFHNPKPDHNIITSTVHDPNRAVMSIFLCVICPASVSSPADYGNFSIQKTELLKILFGSVNVQAQEEDPDLST